jgi:hypothetical protein
MYIELHMVKDYTWHCTWLHNKSSSMKLALKRNDHAAELFGIVIKLNLANQS